MQFTIHLESVAWCLGGAVAGWLVFRLLEWLLRWRDSERF